MSAQLLRNIYLGCILVGLAIPLLQLFGGAVGGALDGLFDFDFDAETPLPVSLLSLAFAAVVLGVSGLICLTRLPLLPCALTSLAAGIVAGLLLQQLVIAPLKRSRPRAHSIDDLPWTQGTVKLEIRSDFDGTIMVPSAIGSQVTYSARLAPWVEGPLRIGETVVVVEVDSSKKFCLVSPVGQTEQPE